MKKITLLFLSLLTFSAFAQVKVDSTGNVLIGDSSSSYSSLLFKSSGPSSGYLGVFEIGSFTVPGSGIAKFLTHFKTNTNGVGLTRQDVAFDGRVGIGTTTPSEKLDIESLSDTNLRLHTSSDTSHSGIIFSGKRENSSINSTHYIGTTGTSSFNLLIESDESVFFKNNNATSMTVHATGRVGIGTATPDTKLDVNGVIRSSNEVQVSAINPGFLFEETDLADKNWHLQVNGGDFKFFEVNDARTTWDEVMIIKSNSGNVGIGTTDTFGHKLAVNGSIIAKGDIIMNDPNPSHIWPDYVFEKDYNLLSLEEVERHIKEKGHLPNIPSAKEVKKNGFSLGEMNRKLLEKVEELMLYTIQQEKRIKALEDKLANKKG